MVQVTQAMPVAAPPRRATLDDLARVPGKAELIAGEVVEFMPTGFLPGMIAGRIYRNLSDFVDTFRAGYVLMDNVGYAVPELTSGRESFSPDVSYYSGPKPKNLMRFVPGPPDFAVEVRSECDYGPAAEREMAAKRDDYFEAGTLVVWDVDPDACEVRFYRAGEASPRIFTIADEADAEPAVPGWRIVVRSIMEQ
jgi:Uma2 family endonuclease